MPSGLESNNLTLSKHEEAPKKKDKKKDKKTEPEIESGPVLDEDFCLVLPPSVHASSDPKDAFDADGRLTDQSTEESHPVTDVTVKPLETGLTVMLDFLMVQVCVIDAFTVISICSTHICGVFVSPSISIPGVTWILTRVCRAWCDIRKYLFLILAKAKIGWPVSRHMTYDWLRY